MLHAQQLTTKLDANEIDEGKLSEACVIDFVCFAMLAVDKIAPFFCSFRFNCDFCCLPSHQLSLFAGELETSKWCVMQRSNATDGLGRELFVCAISIHTSNLCRQRRNSVWRQFQRRYFGLCVEMINLKLVSL